MLTRTTACGRARKLIPLYAAGDLAGRRGRRVAAHVESCGACRRLAAEFDATREWARAAAEPPELGAEFYEELRAGVLDEIRRGDRRPAAPRRAPLFAALSGRRLVYATSFALALVACALALNFYSRRTADAPRPLAVMSSPASTPSAIRDAVVVVTPAPQPRAPRPHTTPERASERPSRPHRMQRAAGNNPRKTLNTPYRTTQEYAAGHELNAGAPAVPPTRRAAAGAAAPTKPGEVARIEMQTADPNIRIIWLAPQERDAPAPKQR